MDFGVLKPFEVLNKMGKKAGLFKTLGLAALLSLPSIAKSQQGYISNLFNEDPISNATVEYGGRTATTDDNGYFHFETPVGENPIITIPSNENLSYSVFNTLGRKVEGNLIPRGDMVTWNGQNYASGMYFLVAKDAYGNLVKTSKGVKFGSENINFPVDLEGKVVKSSGKGGIRTQSLDCFDEFVVNAPGYFERITFVNPGFGDLINETMVDSNFNMDAYNQITERNQEGRLGTKRWINSPNFYVITGGLLGHWAVDVPSQAELDSVESIIRNDLPVFTQGLVNDNTLIEYGQNPHVHYTNEGYLRPDSSWVPIFWSSNSEVIDNLGWHAEYMNENNPSIIQAGMVALRSTVIPIYRFVGLQELSQVMGARMDTRLDSSSVFYGNTQDGDPPAGIGLTEGIYSESDLKYGKFLYKRVPGNQSPDTDVRRYVEMMSQRE
jgi:hypothetical protein